MLEWRRFEVQGHMNCIIVASDVGVRTIEFGGGPVPSGRHGISNLLLGHAIDQLRAYFAGELREFNLPLDMQGTPFQKQVWQELRNIPYGRTRSYGLVASAIGAPKAVRAVGAANGRNPIPIVVPCHRVIGAGGSLVGYGGGLPLKRYLLDLETQYALPS